MAHSAITNKEDAREIYDTPEVVEEKIMRLAELVKQSQHMVVFTGAGISTSAGIHDFRGPKGKWTREAQGLKPLQGVSSLCAIPTPTHMSFVKLEEEGVLKYMISQNCDGLNVRCGYPQNKLSELHGNGNIAICENCGQKYFADRRQPQKKHTGMPRDRWTGGHCRHEDCTGRLLKSTICFGQNLPERPLELANEHSEKADLHVALGSSLRVTPAADCCEITAEKPDGNLVIVNLQKTPLTDIALFQIYAKTDHVMSRLMEILGYEIPEFRLRRKVVCGVDPDGDGLYIRGADKDDLTLEHDFIKEASWGTPKIREGEGFEHAGQVIESKVQKNRFSGKQLVRTMINNLNEKRVFVPVDIVSMGHYGEPLVTLSNDFTEAYTNGQRVEYLWHLEFNPFTKTWTKSVELSPVPKHSNREMDDSFGRICRDYAIAGLVKNKRYRTCQAKKMYEKHVKKNQKVV